MATARLLTGKGSPKRQPLCCLHSAHFCVGLSKEYEEWILRMSRAACEYLRGEQGEANVVSCDLVWPGAIWLIVLGVSTLIAQDEVVQCTDNSLISLRTDFHGDIK